MMRSKFEDELTVNTAGEVDAKGTFEWGPGEEKAVVQVCFMQDWGNGKLAKVGAAKGVFLKSEAGGAWRLMVASGQPPTNLNAGPSTLAVGSICALGTDIEMRQFGWTQDVKLKGQA